MHLSFIPPPSSVSYSGSFVANTMGKNLPCMQTGLPVNQTRPPLLRGTEPRIPASIVSPHHQSHLLESTSRQSMYRILPATSATCDSILPTGLSAPNSTCEIMSRRLTRPLLIATIADRAGPEAELESRSLDDFIRSWQKSGAMHGSYNAGSYRSGVLASFRVFLTGIKSADGVSYLA